MAGVDWDVAERMSHGEPTHRDSAAEFQTKSKIKTTGVERMPSAYRKVVKVIHAKQQMEKEPNNFELWFKTKRGHEHLSKSTAKLAQLQAIARKM